MRIPRFHSPIPLAEGVEVALDASAAQHAVAVLRLGVGAPLTLFDGRGGEHPAVLSRVTKSAVHAAVGARRAIEREPPFPIVLGQALAKGERMDLVVQKAVELGATALVPLATERSEVRLDAERAAKRVLHWQGVVRAACEQSGRNRLTEVGAPQALDVFLAAAPPDALRLVLAPDGAALRDLPRPGPVGLVLLVGPEGGLSDAELARTEAAGFARATLGPRVLRTETAALAALAAVHAVWG
jgi:16S rRNA (uracil1498-N3)-methyltransferase